MATEAEYAAFCEMHVNHAAARLLKAIHALRHLSKEDRRVVNACVRNLQQGEEDPLKPSTESPSCLLS